MINGVEPVVKIVFGYVMVVVSWAFTQVSESLGGIIDKGFDAGLSIGLLIVGLVVLSWYHYKYQQHNREVIAKLAEDKDGKAEEYHELALQQIQLSQEQIQTNKDLRQALQNLEHTIQRNTN